LHNAHPAPPGPAHPDHRNGHAGHVHAPPRFGAAFALGALLNIGLVAAELGFGVIANSVALLADGIHNLGDVLGLLLAWGAMGLGRKLPSARHTYGLGRGTILAALVNGMVLMASVGIVALEAVRRLANPAPVGTVTVMAVAGAGIVVNGLTAWLFSSGRERDAGRTDINILAIFQHMAADAALSGGVVVAALLIILTGWHWIDPLVSLLIVVTIVAGTWGVLREAVNLAMDGVPAGISGEEVAAALQALPGVREVHDLHIWGMSTTTVALTAHLVCDDPASDQALMKAAGAMLRERFGIGHATLQLETPESAADCAQRPADMV
jgi:cobalt-zinc-cadmium efflux system protein